MPKRLVLWEHEREYPRTIRFTHKGEHHSFVARWSECLGVGIEWKPQDLWVGVFWKHNAESGDFNLWLCLLPMIPIHFWWLGREADD